MLFAAAADDISFRLIVSSHSPDLLVSIGERGAFTYMNTKDPDRASMLPCYSSTLVPRTYHHTTNNIHGP